jgi:tetratricopeptide (TPR) repeat protein
MQLYDKALAIVPKATGILGNKGIVLIKLGYYNEAILIFDRILAIEPNNVIGLYNKGVCLDKLGEHIQSKELHNKALHINPKYSGDYQNRIAVATKLSKPQVDVFAPAV